MSALAVDVLTAIYAAGGTVRIAGEDRLKVSAPVPLHLDARGPAAARRELADIGEVLEAAIKFAHIERGLSSDLET